MPALKAHAATHEFDQFALYTSFVTLAALLDRESSLGTAPVAPRATLRCRA